MGKALSIGRLGMSSVQDAAVSYLGSIGLTGEQHLAWMRCAGDVDSIDSLNSASVCVFLDHVARLEGFPDSRVAIEETQFRQLPWWDSGIWLPISFEPPTLLDDSGVPVFLGCCHTLLADLDGVRSLSGLDLGRAPHGYAQMRADVKAFYRSGFQLEDEASIVQWIWKAFHDGAEIAIKRSAPLFGGPG
jgi:hypothetical protein